MVKKKGNPQQANAPPPQQPKRLFLSLMGTPPLQFCLPSKSWVEHPSHCPPLPASEPEWKLDAACRVYGGVHVGHGLCSGDANDDAKPGLQGSCAHKKTLCDEHCVSNRAC